MQADSDQARPFISSGVWYKAVRERTTRVGEAVGGVLRKSIGSFKWLL